MSKAKNRPGLLWLLVLGPVLIGAGWLLTRDARGHGEGLGNGEVAAAPLLPEAEAEALQSSPQEDSQPARRQEPSGNPSPEAAEPSMPLDPEPKTKLLTIHGQTLDVLGQAVPFVDLIFEDAPETVASSDSAGFFELQFETGSSQNRLQASGIEFATLVGCRLKASSADELQYVVVAPAVNFGGRVVDQAGQPLHDVRIQLDRWKAGSGSFPHALDQGIHSWVLFKTDGQGKFREDALPGLERLKLSFSTPGHTSFSMNMPVQDRLDLNIVLEKTAQQTHVAGRVLLPDLSPAVGARVFFHDQEATTDEAGRFRLNPGVKRLAQRDSSKAIPLAAGLAPYGAALIEDFASQLDALSPSLPQDLVLVLAEQALSLEGRVIDHKGQALGGWKVMLIGGLELTTNLLPVPTAESLSGASSVTTDDHGQFEIGGLMPREYKLWAYDPKNLRSIRLEQNFVAGEEGIRLELQAQDFYGELRGLVVTPNGLPLAGVSVMGNLITSQTSSGVISTTSDAVQADSEGHFVLKNLGKQGVKISVAGDELIPRQFVIEPEMDPLSLRLEVNRRCHFRLFVAGVGAVKQSIRFEDAEGQGLQIYIFQSNGWSSRSKSMIDPESPGVMAVSEAAVAVLVGLEDPVRHEIQLIPGQVTELHVQQ